MNRRQALAAGAATIVGLTAPMAVAQVAEKEVVECGGVVYGHWLQVGGWWKMKVCTCTDADHQQYHKELYSRTGVALIDKDTPIGKGTPEESFLRWGELFLQEFRAVTASGKRLHFFVVQDMTENGESNGMSSTGRRYYPLRESRHLLGNDD